MEETNIQTQEKRLAAGCFMPLIARWMTFMIPASNRTTESVDTLRNSIDAHNEAVGNAIRTVIEHSSLPKPNGSGESGPTLPDRITFSGG